MLGDEDDLLILLRQEVHDQAAEGLYGQQKDRCTGEVKNQMGIGHLLGGCSPQVLDEQGEAVYEGQKEQDAKEIEEELGSAASYPGRAAFYHLK